MKKIKKKSKSERIILESKFKGKIPKTKLKNAVKFAIWKNLEKKPKKK